MRNIVSPLDGFASPFGRRGLSKYAIGNFDPALVADFDDEYYRAKRQKTTFDGLLTHSRLSNATMVDSDGLIKWGPHNLALNSAAPATQSITVISGADYTVECTGVSIVLSGAGTGTVTEGNPVTITASTTTLTLTVTGSTGTMWVYRSDLGGMVNNPDTGNSYVPTTSSARYLPRRGHHVWNGSAWVNEGLLIETEARTNLLHTTNALVTQTLTVTAVPHTLHFTGTGTVTLSGASTDGPLVGTGTGEQNRVSLTFTPTAGLLMLIVTGTVADAQLEVGSTPSSYIPNLAASGSVNRTPDILTIPSAKLPWPTPKVIGEEKWNTPTISDPAVWSWDGSTLTGTGDGTSDTANGDAVTAGGVYLITYNVTKVSGLCQVRLGNSFIETIGPNGLREKIVVAANSTGLSFTDSGSFIGTIDNISVREIDPLAVSIQMDGRMTYADEGSVIEANLWYWYASSQNNIRLYIDTSTTKTGGAYWIQEANNIREDFYGAGDAYTPGTLVPYNISSRHGSTFVNGAVDGTALTADTTPVALPDLSATNLDLAYDYMGTIRQFRVWAADLGDSGIEEASEGEPSSYLIWDASADTYIQKVYD